ncbi:DUF6483 family protein [Paenibacillus tarimensis]|uniref:DUF6483 family protein n=1 Tax=Paenibacillus tarimensis TaxID=416012 RepID=UPI001F37C32B|nr:DUF6483 family protein [Paenibacillus tarimensis]MCF2943653.1 DUF6483 family protein [Paenibacillus tarimensis]
MFQRDYFMRMIEQVGEAVGQVMGLRQRKEHLEAMKVIDDLFERHLRLQPRLIHALSDKDIADLLTTNGVVDTAALEAIALLLRHMGEIHAEQGQEAESYARYVKSLALNLRLLLYGADPVVSEPRREAELLMDRLRPYELPASVKEQLASWHEAEGRYAEAENIIHELLEDRELEAGRASDFYRRLMLKEDAELSAGGLPRDELEQGIEQLEKWSVRGRNG